MTLLDTTPTTLPQAGAAQRRPTLPVLRIVLALTGLAVVALGLNIGFGGIRTLGWQGAQAFVTVTDPAVFAIRDSHVRFIGGVWLGVGLVLLAGGVAPDRMRTAVLAACMLVVVGALSRFSAADWTVLAGGDIAPSLACELILFPLLAIWVMRTTGPGRQRAGTAQAASDRRIRAAVSATP